jgi:hypothetical protein
VPASPGKAEEAIDQLAEAGAIAVRRLAGDQSFLTHYDIPQDAQAGARGQDDHEA